MTPYLAKPTMTTPVRNPGKSGKQAQARAVMTMGPIIQLMTTEIRIWIQILRSCKMM